MKRDKAITQITRLIEEATFIDHDLAEEIAVSIYDDIIAECVEAERNEWILLSKAAPVRPDGRGFDS